jgi:hypothetical protein
MRRPRSIACGLGTKTPPGKRVKGPEFSIMHGFKTVPISSTAIRRKCLRHLDPPPGSTC